MGGECGKVEKVPWAPDLSLVSDPDSGFGGPGDLLHLLTSSSSSCPESDSGSGCSHSRIQSRGNGISLRPVVCNDSLGRPLKGILKNNQCSTLPRQSCSCGWGLADEDLHQGGHLDLHSTGLAPPLPPPPLPDSSPAGPDLYSSVASSPNHYYSANISSACEPPQHQRQPSTKKTKQVKNEVIDTVESSV